MKQTLHADLWPELQKRDNGPADQRQSGHEGMTEFSTFKFRDVYLCVFFTSIYICVCVCGGKCVFTMSQDEMCHSLIATAERGAGPVTHGETCARTHTHTDTQQVYLVFLC